MVASQPFTNRYTPEKLLIQQKIRIQNTDEEKRTAKTGETYQVSWMLVGLLLVGIVVVVYRRQKRK